MLLFISHFQLTTVYDKKPIHFAAQGGSKDVIEFFLSRSISVNDIDKKGWTPLHYAASAGQLEAVKFLVGRGANILAKDKNGKTPLDIANDKTEVASFLREKQTEYNNLLLAAVRNGNVSEVTTAIKLRKKRWTVL